MTKVMVQVHQMRKKYGETKAADDVEFEIFEGEIFGMIGPNGAGKTTTIECVEGLREPDQGDLRVLDFHPRKDGYKLRPRIGVQLQESALPDRIRVWEALDLYRSFYSETLDMEMLLDRLGLSELRDRIFAKLSGGQKQRLFIALALESPEKLVKNLEMENRVVFTPLDDIDIEKVKALKSVSRLENMSGRIVAHGTGDLLIADIVNFLTSNHIRFCDLRTEQPDLEDVFLKLTGESIRN